MCKEIGIKSFATFVSVMIVVLTLVLSALIYWSNIADYLQSGDRTQKLDSIAGKLHTQVLAIISSDPSSPPQLEALQREAVEIRESLSGKDVQRLSAEELQYLIGKLQGIIQALDASRAGNSAYRKSLVNTVNELSHLRKDIGHPNEGSNRHLHAFVQGTKDFWSWAGPGNMLLLALLAMTMFVLTRDGVLQKLLGPGSQLSIELWGIKLGAANLSRQKTELANSQKLIEAQVAEQYLTQIVKLDLDESYDRFCEIIADCMRDDDLDLNTIGHRRTMFVPTYLSEDLIQATEYRGVQFRNNAKKYGRIFSVRYGIIGKSWRLRQPLYNPEVSNTDSALIRDWGLTQAEAKKQGAQKRALLAVPIIGEKQESDPLGLLYFEGFATKAFGDPKDPDAYAQGVLEKSSQNPAFRQLVEKLEELETEIKWSSKSIQGDGR